MLLVPTHNKNWYYSKIMKLNKYILSSITFLLLISVQHVYGQKINKTIYKKDCGNCKFILSEAKEAYKKNFEEASKENFEISNYAKKLIDFEKISNLKLKAKKAFVKNNMNEFYETFEKIKSISTRYISNFKTKTNGDAYLFIQLENKDNGDVIYKVYVDSGVKYGSFRIYYDLETNTLAHIKVDGVSYKSFMKNNTSNKTADNITVWVFKNYETLAYTMNRETKADSDFLEICNQYIEYNTTSYTNNFTLIGAKKSTITSVSLRFKNCK